MGSDGGEKSSPRRGLIGLCRNHPAEVEVALMIEAVVLLVTVVIVFVKLVDLVKRKCCSSKKQVVETPRPTNMAPVDEEIPLQMVSPPVYRRLPYQPEPEAPKYTLNFTLPDFNPLSFMRTMTPAFPHEGYTRPAIQNRSRGTSRFDEESEYASTSAPRDRRLRAEATYQNVGRRMSSLAPALPRPPMELPLPLPE